LKKKTSLPMVILIAAMIFIYIPLVLLVINSFNGSRFSTVWGGFSLKWYAKLFQDKSIARSLTNTLIVTLSSVTFSTTLGTLAGVVISLYQSKLQKVHKSILLLPLVMPDILMGIGLLFFFMTIKVKLSLLTIILGHVTFTVSYVASTVRSQFQNFDYSVIEAAKDLGAHSWQILWKIYIPLLMPGIISGAMLAMTLSLDDFVITFFISGPGSSTLPIQIYSMIRFGTPPVINALSTIFISITFILMLIYQRFSRRSLK
jgi:spermidine/putrescine transport system permease protein